MDSDTHDLGTPGGRLNTLRPLKDNGDPILNYEWAEKMGIGADVLGYILKNVKNPGMGILNQIDRWLIRQGYSDEVIRWWRLGDRCQDEALGKEWLPPFLRRGGMRKANAFSFLSVLEGLNVYLC